MQVNEKSTKELCGVDRKTCGFAHELGFRELGHGLGPEPQGGGYCGPGCGLYPTLGIVVQGGGDASGPLVGRHRLPQATHRHGARVCCQRLERGPNWLRKHVPKVIAGWLW